MKINKFILDRIEMNIKLNDLGYPDTLPCYVIIYLLLVMIRDFINCFK